MSRSRHGAPLAMLLAALVIASGCTHDTPTPPPPPPSKPTIVLSTSTIDFAGMAGTADPAEQMIDVTASDGSLSGMTIRVVYASGQPSDWLDASLSGSVSPAKLILRPKLASLAVQSYLATVEISAPNAKNSPRQVAVTLRVSAPPMIALSRTNVLFSATRSRSSPPPETVTISNGGGGTLEGITASVAYDNGQPTGWLTPTLSGSAAPAILTLSAATGSLAAGSYTASVTLRSTAAGAVPQTIGVRFDVGGLPCIALSQQSLTTQAVTGGINPPPLSLAVTNSADGVLNNLAVAVAYQSGQPTGWLAAALDQTTAPATLTLQPNVGSLQPGAYAATVSVSSAGACNSPVQATVTFNVDAPALPPRIVLSSSLAQFTASTANPADIAIGITNGGGGTLAGLSAEIAYAAGGPSGWLNAVISSASAPATLVLRAALGSLTPGTYSALVSVKAPGASNSPQPVAVTFTVIAPEVPAIGLSRSSLSFAAIEGGAAPAAQSIAISNAGTGTLDGLAATVAYAAGEPGGWLVATLSQTAAPSTLSVRAVPSALGPGTYHAAIAIASPSAANSPQTVMVTVTVDRAPAIHVLYSSISFVSIVGGADPQPLIVDVQNSGGGTLDGLAVAVTYNASEPAGWMNATIDRTTAPAKITLQPRTGSLPVGAYHASLTISSPAATNSPIAIPLGFAVNPAPVIQPYSSTAAFTMVSGGPNPAPAKIDVVNGGAGTLTDLSADVSYASGQQTGWLRATLSSTTAPSVLSLEVSATALVAGTYAASVTLRSSVQGVAPRTVAVGLTIAPPVIQPAIGLSTEAITLSGPQGTDVSSPNVSVFNAGDGTLSGLSLGVDYGAGQPTNWLGVSLDQTQAPATLSMKFATRDLPLGRYDATITVRSSLAGVAPRTVALTVSVTQSGAVISLSPTSVNFTVAQNATIPPPQRISIANGGTDVLSRLAVRVDYPPGADGWLGGAMGEGDIPNTTAPTVLLLAPTTTSLAPGSYAATITVFSSLQGIAPKTVSVSLTVTPVRSISLSPASVTFNATQGGANPAVKTVSVNDSGSGSITGLVASAPSYGAGQPAGWLTPTLSSTSTPSTLSLQPTVGSLTPGTYTATVSVSSPDAANSPQVVSVSLVVAPATYTLTTTVEPVDGGVVGRSPDQGTYVAGTTVTLTPRPNVGWKLLAWTGDASGTSDPLSVSMNANKTVHAVFALKAPVLSAPAQATGAIVVSWTYAWPCSASSCLASSNDRFELEESRSPSTGFVVVFTSPLGDHFSPNSASLTRAPGTYYYRLRAFSRFGFSLYSDVQTVIVSQPALAAPANLAANAISASQINLTWGDVANESGFYVERCAGDACTNFTRIATLTANVTAYQNVGLAAATRYSYRVQAFGSAGLSAYSNIASVTTAQSLTATKFQNNAAWAVVSLKIDGVEQVTVPGYGIASGGAYTASLPAGAHSYSAITGDWDGNTRVPMYSYSGTFNQTAGVVGLVTFNNPTVAQVLTNFASSLRWEGSYWDIQNLTTHVKTYRFFSSGSCTYFFDTVQQTTCAISTTSYVAGIINFRVSYTDGRPSEDGTFYELLGYFVMKNGPQASLIQYTNTFNP